MIMPFTSFKEPADLSRAKRALDAAWRQLEPEVPDFDRGDARTRLAYIVASYVHTAIDEGDLIRRAIERFRRKPSI